MNLRSPAAWGILIGLVSIAFAIPFETTTHCIYLDKKPICPGTVVDVENEVTIMTGFRDDSAEEATETPAWVEKTYKLEKLIPNEYSIPMPNGQPFNWRISGLSGDISKVTFDSDNCLYIRVQIYPWWAVLAPPVAIDEVTNVLSLGHGTKVNYNDQRIGCPHEKYEGPEMANPWNLLGYRRPGHTIAGPPNHKTGQPILDDRLRPDSEDFRPLNPHSKPLSKADEPSTVASADGTDAGSEATSGNGATQPGSHSTGTEAGNIGVSTYPSLGQLNTDGTSDAVSTVPQAGTTKPGTDVSFNFGATGENTGATSDTSTTQPFDTASVAPDLSGTANTEQDRLAQANSFTTGSTLPGFGDTLETKARRSARDFHVWA